MAKEERLVNLLINKYGQLYSEMLDINLESKKETEIFKWFLASILFGKRISEKIAVKAYKEFEKENILTPKRILEKKWEGLVEILDRGDYIRYDFSTATNLLEIMRMLLEKYGKSKPLSNLYSQSSDAQDLKRRLQEFRGIGPVTTSIFLREMRHVWKKSDAEILPIIRTAANQLRINLDKFNKRTKKFARLECALYRYAKESKLKRRENLR